MTLPIVHVVIPAGTPGCLIALLAVAGTCLPPTLLALARYRNATMPQNSRDRRAVIEGGRAYRLQVRREKRERSEARRRRRKGARVARSGTGCVGGCPCQWHEAVDWRPSEPRPGKSPP
jgi:hypothetical protein